MIAMSEPLDDRMQRFQAWCRTKQNEVDREVLWTTQSSHSGNNAGLGGNSLDDLEPDLLREVWRWTRGAQ
jgi:hypothetical protein